MFLPEFPDSHSPSHHQATFGSGALRPTAFPIRACAVARQGVAPTEREYGVSLLACSTPHRPRRTQASGLRHTRAPSSRSRACQGVVRQSGSSTIHKRQKNEGQKTGAYIFSPPFLGAEESGQSVFRFHHSSFIIHHSSFSPVAHHHPRALYRRRVVRGSHHSVRRRSAVGPRHRQSGTHAAADEHRQTRQDGAAAVGSTAEAPPSRLATLTLGRFAAVRNRPLSRSCS